MGGKKIYLFGEGTVFQYRPLVLKCPERLGGGGSFKAFILFFIVFSNHVQKMMKSQANDFLFWVAVLKTT